ncbi:MAG: cupin domain-containing protein, partial [Mycobacterium kyogaense]|uniref:cupin domain-containing protein n=1 Tax=Mycobacterium kyogaense TaxID=2212479 RepID=UPI002FF553AE
MTGASYYTPRGGLPPQTDLLTDRAIVTEAYTVIPRGVLSDIVTSVFPEWTDTRAWIINRPVAGGATTYYQAIVEVAPGGGATRPEPQPEVAGFLFVTSGALTVDAAGQSRTLTAGGFAYLPAGTEWSAANNGDDSATFVWIRKRYEAIDGHAPSVQFGNEQDIEPSAMPGTDGKWRTTRMLDPQDLAYDMHVNIVTFEPGATIPF